MRCLSHFGSKIDIPDEIVDVRLIRRLYKPRQWTRSPLFLLISNIGMHLSSRFDLAILFYGREAVGRIYLINGEIYPEVVVEFKLELYPRLRLKKNYTF